MLKIAVILCSTRPGRKGEAVAHWIHGLAQKREDAEFELVDLKDFELPLLDEPTPASQHNYTKPHTKRWSEAIAPFDGFVFVMPEYNHGVSGALKNALDFLYAEWNNKAAGFVGYGGMGALRAVEHMRPILANLQIATVAAQVALSLRADWKEGTFTPNDYHEPSVEQVLDQVIAWSSALKPLRKA